MLRKLARSTAVAVVAVGSFIAFAWVGPAVADAAPARCPTSQGSPMGTITASANAGGVGEYGNGNSPLFGALYNGCSGTIEFFVSGQSFRFYQVRWSRPGRAETQFSIGEAEGYVFHNVHPGTRYVFKLQGCVGGAFGSTCSTWAPALEIFT